VVRGVLAFAGERLAAHAGVTVSTAVRERLVRHWLGARAEDRPDPATAVTLATQGSASVEPYVARFLPALVTAAVVPPVAVAVLAVVDWASALVVVLTLPLLPLFAALIGATTRDATERRWQALAGLSGHFLDVMRGLPTLVAYGRADRQVGTIGAVSQRHRRATMATLRLAFLSSAALELLATICVAIVAVLVGIRLSHGSMYLSTGLLAILLAPEAYWPVRRVGAEFHSAADGAQALADLRATLASVDAPPAATFASKGNLMTDRLQPVHQPETFASKGSCRGVEARGLGYSYPRATAAVLEVVDVVVGRGLTVVTGPSGCGKTTLLELLAGLRTPTSGSVTAPAAHLVTQRPFLAHGSIGDNLALGNPGATPAQMWAALRDVALEGLVAGLPDGLDTPLGDDGRGLSAGQRARLVLARAALSAAPLVLLDEPTAHLDAASAAAAHRVIRDLAVDRCVIAVTHRPELVALADTHLHLPATARLAALAVTT
jgi:ATP-binding cassette subfamily C protein CydD/ATP-binding cassette subfamily C protein CydCD